MASNYITAIRTSTGDKQIDYEALANKPKKFTTVSVNGNNISSTVENDTLSFTAGSGISLTPNATNKTINIDISDTLAGSMGEVISPMLVSDATKDLYGFESDASLDDILRAIRGTISRKVLEVKVYTPGGIPIQGVVVTGMVEDCITDVNGCCMSTINEEAASVSIKVAYSGYKDVISTKTVTYSPNKNLYQSLDIYMDRIANPTSTFSSSTTFTFSPDVSEVNVSCAGGGGGGGGSNYGQSGGYWGEGTGGGGGGGNIANIKSISLEQKENIIDIVVGSGGAGGNPGKDNDSDRVATAGGNGGDSTFSLNGNIIVTGLGGKGGSPGVHRSNGAGGAGNGAGGRGGANGVSATVQMLYPSTISVGGGGAGGAGSEESGYNEETINGGSPYGGSSRYYRAGGNGYYESTDGSGYGGGGAGGHGSGQYGNEGANGYQGLVGISWSYRNE